MNGRSGGSLAHVHAHFCPFHRYATFNISFLSEAYMNDTTATAGPPNRRPQRKIWRALAAKPNLPDSFARLHASVIAYFLALDDTTEDDVLAYERRLTEAENALRAAIGLPPVPALLEVLS
jgi:hypothetical protein